MRHMLKTTSIFVCLAATPALAQQLEGGWLIKTSNVVSPSNPSTTVEAWAWFDDPQATFAFGYGDFDFVAGEGLFSDAQAHLLYPNATPGVTNGNVVEGVAVGQIVFALGAPYNADNPVLVWSADWTTTNFAPRSVDLLTTKTTNFQLGSVLNGGLTQLYPQGFIPGTGAVEVVPSPASALPMVLVGAGLLRRRRSR